MLTSKLYIFIYLKILRRSFFAFLHNLVITKSDKKSYFNFNIINLFYETVQGFETKLGYLLQNIAVNCDNYFYAHTNKKSAELYLKYFLTASDMISRRKRNKEQKIYLGRNVISIFRKIYDNYLFTLSALGFDIDSDPSQDITKSMNDENWLK